MRALTYHGAKDVRVENVPDPTIVNQDDILLRITATAICGSDLHLYRGKIPEMKSGDILGHEFMGVVEETGREVKGLKKGDRVVIPFVIACGECFHCQLQEFSACETTNTGKGAALNQKGIKPPAALFGYSHLHGGVPGGQAEYVRVPHANVGPIKIPDVLSDEQVLFLSDILPTGYQAALNAGIKEGSSVAIFGAGPVGLMSAHARACWAPSRFSWSTITLIGWISPRRFMALSRSISTETTTQPRSSCPEQKGAAWTLPLMPWVSKLRAAKLRR